VIDPKETAEAWRSPQGRDPFPFGDALTTMSDQRGWASRLHGAKIHAAWEEIVGPELFRHTRPVRLHGGVLVVRAVTTIWAAEVRALGGVLAARADAVLGDGSVRQVTVVTGPLTLEKASDPPPARH